MTEERLDKIREHLVYDIMRNWDYVFSDEVRGNVDLLSVIASLYNLLHKEVTGEDYEYFFHWANKVGGYVDDNYFDENGDYHVYKEEENG